MKIITKITAGFLLLLLMMTLKGQAAEQPKESADLGDIEITGEAKDKVILEKMVPDIEIQIRDLVDSVTDKTEKLLEQGKPIPSEEDFDQFKSLGSRQTAQPWLPEFSEPPLISFFPRVSETTVKSWRLEVTDEHGNIIRTLKGRKNPVAKIDWDGVDEKGTIIRVGSHYSFRFITIDEFNYSHTTLGTAFSLSNLKFNDKKNLYLEISNDMFFDEFTIKAQAQQIFKKVIDILRQYSQHTFTVEYYTKNPRGELVRKRQETVTGEIAKAMQLLPEDVRYSYPEIGNRGDIIRFVVHLK
ncbi:MAG: hypothetical protein ABII23_00920 [bacterium]